MSKEISLLDLVIIIAKHKKSIIIHFFLISIISLIFALLLTKLYRSEVVFIPKSDRNSGLISLIGSNLSADLVGGSNLSKRQFKFLLYSRELREKLIDEFNLIEYYEYEKRINPRDYTLRKLLKVIEIIEEAEGGLGITDVISITIRVIDKDPQMAADMANYLYELLNNKAIELNRSEFNNVSNFLVKQINNCNSILDSVRVEKKQFQMEHHAYDISQQVSMVLRAFGTTKAEILALENRIQYLKKIHANDFSGITILKQKKAAFEERLEEMEKSSKNDVFLGLTKSLDLSNKYVDLHTEVETYTHLRSLLKQQLEQAKIKQSKTFSPLHLVDKARPAEYKFKPKRALVMIAIVGLYMIAYITIILLWDHYQYLKTNEPQKVEKIDALRQNLSFKRK